MTRVPGWPSPTPWSRISRWKIVVDVTSTRSCTSGSDRAPTDARRPSLAFASWGHSSAGRAPALQSPSERQSGPAGPILLGFPPPRLVRSPTVADTVLGTVLRRVASQGFGAQIRGDDLGDSSTPQSRGHARQSSSSRRARRTRPSNSPAERSRYEGRQLRGAPGAGTEGGRRPSCAPVLLEELSR